MIDLISDLDNNMYFVRENEQDIAVFNSLEEAQNFINSYTQ